MSFKLATKNIHKSIKDYSIYFFTLVVAVAIFYIFNSLDAQESMLQLTESKMDIIKTLVNILGYLSLFITVILGFLIIYSNNFLIKRRKKEFGLYLTLGMSKRKVSYILVIETMIVGLISLAVGLIIGVILSQFLSILTAKLFEVNMTKFEFVFSSHALVKSILYFGLIFVLVMIFNIISISRYKLIDLLTASKKNEKIKLRNKYVVIIAFITSICCLVYAYHSLFNGAIINFEGQKFIMMLLSGAVGTFLLFFSAAGFLLRVAQLNKKFYFKNLNMFVLKQINNKVNTTVFSTTIICLMLLLTIGILSSSISLTTVFNSSISSNNITDFTITSYSDNCTEGETYTECYQKPSDEGLSEIVNRSYFVQNVKNYVYYHLYNDDSLTATSIIDKKSLKQLYEDYGDAVTLNGNLDIISESDYNKILALYGESKDQVDLSANEYLLSANLDAISKYYDSYYEDGGTIQLNNTVLTPASDKIINIALMNSSSGSNYGTIIVDDSVISNLTSSYGVIIGNYVQNNNKEDLEESFLINLSNESNTINFTSKIDMENANIGIKAIFTFIGLYLGIIFAISSATILAIGQLSESSDNKDRYKVLRELGADNKMIKKALISQIGFAFGAPLLVAVIHSIFGLKEINSVIKILGNINLSSNIILTTLFIVALYGGYFLVTYLCSKSIINKE